MESLLGPPGALRWREDGAGGVTSSWLSPSQLQEWEGVGRMGVNLNLLCRPCPRQRNRGWGALWWWLSWKPASLGTALNSSPGPGGLQAQEAQGAGLDGLSRDVNDPPPRGGQRSEEQGARSKSRVAREGVHRTPKGFIPPLGLGKEQSTQIQPW